LTEKNYNLLVLLKENKKGTNRHKPWYFCRFCVVGGQH